MTSNYCNQTIQHYRELGFRDIVTLEVDRRRLWVCYDKIPIYPIFYLLKGDYRV